MTEEDSAYDAAQEQWQQSYERERAASGERRESFVRSDGTSPVKPLYSPDPDELGDVEDFLKTVGFPGQAPYTRGRTASGHRTFPWKLGYYSGFGNPAQTNERIRTLIARGADYATIALDLPSQHALDPDDPQAAADVGRVGVSVACLQDLEAVFDGVDLAKVGTGTVGNAISPIMVGLFIGVGAHQGVEARNMRITLQNDPLKEFTGRGTQIVPIEPSVALAGDVTEYCIRHLPRWIPQYACSTQFRWAGATAAQEIGFGIANLTTYIDEMVARGLDPGEVAARMEGLHMTADNDLFEEVAKFRAARRLWARYAADRYNSNDPRLTGLKITVFTGAHRLTPQVPLLNITRTTVHVLAALLGGVERLTIPAYDEALALPTEHSTRIANYTKMVLLDEHNVGHSVDPLGGSYLVESLTDELEEEAGTLLSRIDEQGGAKTAISAGTYEKATLRELMRESKQVEDGTRRIVGVNYLETHQDDTEYTLFRGDEHYLTQRIQDIQRFRQHRSATEATRALDDLNRQLEKKTTDLHHNVVPAFINAVRSGVTIGELGRSMRAAFGEAR